MRSSPAKRSLSRRALPTLDLFLQNKLVPPNEGDEESGVNSIHSSPQKEVAGDHELKKIHRRNENHLKDRAESGLDPRDNPKCNADFAKANSSCEEHSMLVSEDARDNFVMARDKHEHFANQPVHEPYDGDQTLKE